MLKRLLLIITILLFTNILYAGVMTSDPQPGVSSHETTSITQSLTIGSDANADGSLNVNLDQFQQGWHDANVVSCDDYVVEDLTTGVVTRLQKCSEPASVRFKVPNANSASGFKVQE
jgi:hypothetical protein